MLLTLAPLFALAARLAALGEILTDVVPHQRVAIVGPLHSNAPTFKLAEARRRGAELLVLGSSRVMKLRESMFDRCSHDHCFYNAGGGMPTIATGLALLRQLPRDKWPRVLVLGLDLWHFDPAYDADKNEVTKLDIDLRDRLGSALAVTRQVALDLPSEAAVREVVLGRKATPGDKLGLNAIIHDSGFRADGSFSVRP